MTKPNEPTATAPEAHEAVDAFTFEAALLFFRMRLAAEQYLGQGRHSSGRRSILKSIGADGPQGISEMARLRAVSRQHVQKLVATLRADGLVETVPDPDDRRAKLVTLSPAGERFLAAMQRREKRLLAFLAESIPTREFERATALIRTIRGRLESDSWEELATEVRDG
jgi:DNA-binding MarR family transcriptional regulator